MSTPTCNDATAAIGLAKAGIAVLKTGRDGRSTATVVTLSQDSRQLEWGQRKSPISSSKKASMNIKEITKLQFMPAAPPTKRPALVIFVEDESSAATASTPRAGTKKGLKILPALVISATKDGEEVFKMLYEALLAVTPKQEPAQTPRAKEPILPMEEELAAAADTRCLQHGLQMSDTMVYKAMRAHCPVVNDATSFAAARRYLRSLGGAPVVQAELQAMRYVADGHLTTNMKPFNVFARFAAGVSEQRGMTEETARLGPENARRFIMARNLEQHDAQWNSSEREWVGKAAFGQRHRYLVLRDLEWHWCVRSTFRSASTASSHTAPIAPAHGSSGSIFLYLVWRTSRNRRLRSICSRPWNLPRVHM